jgi:hypothetical protein
MFLVRIRALAAVAMAVMLAVSACSHTTTSDRVPVTLALCGTSPAVAPDLIEVICNTDDITARDLTWSAWGKPTATGRGTAVVDVCAYIDCHTGAFSSAAIVLRASGLMRCGTHEVAYASLHYTWVHGSPWPGMPASASTSQFLAGADRPLPPASQTVALTC